MKWDCSLFPEMLFTYTCVCVCGCVGVCGYGVSISTAKCESRRCESYLGAHSWLSSICTGTVTKKRPSLSTTWLPVVLGAFKSPRLELLFYFDTATPRRPNLTRLSVLHQGSERQREPLFSLCWCDSHEKITSSWPHTMLSRFSPVKRNSSRRARWSQRLVTCTRRSFLFVGMKNQVSVLHQGKERQWEQLYSLCWCDFDEKITSSWPYATLPRFSPVTRDGSRYTRWSQPLVA